MPRVSIHCLTNGPKHHFFGYYGITPWNASGKWLVCLESDFQDHLPKPDEAAAVGLVDAKTGEFRKIAETRAWNLQQGAMLHWNPLDPEREIVFNDRKDGAVVSRALNVETGERRWLPRPVSAVSHNGKYALSVSYGRLNRLRPVVGYVGATDPNPTDPHPANDGVYRMDLRTGECRLVVSFDDMYRGLVKKHPEVEGRHLWCEHVVFNRDDTRFLFLARCNLAGDKPRMETGMFTCAIDGSDQREVIPFGASVSHFEWRNAREILATFALDGGERKHYLFTDGLGDYRQVGPGFLIGDGHCSFAPDGRWIVTDRNHGSTREKSISIFDVERNAGLMIGRFPIKQYMSGDTRCDLHPRWNRAGDAICFDALDPRDWTRQLHIASLSF